MTTEMEILKKIILTETELFEIIKTAYLDGFNYSTNYDIEKKLGENWDSKGRDVMSYTRNKIKEILK